MATRKSLRQTTVNASRNAKAKVSQVLDQAKGSLKFLEMLEKEALSKARGFVKIPSAEERSRMTNDKILSSLRKLGVATQAEVDELKGRIEALETRLTAQTGEILRSAQTPNA